MALIDIIYKWFGKAEKPVNPISKAYAGAAYGAGHPILTSLGSWYQDGTGFISDPAQKMAVYNTISSILPFVSKAEQLHADWLGQVVIESDTDPVLAQRLSDYLSRVQVYNEYGVRLNDGVNEYIGAMLQTMLRYGMAFGRQVSTAGGGDNRLHIYSPMDFGYQQEGVGRYVLEWQPPIGGLYRVDEANPDWFTLRRKYLAGHNWGIPMMYGGEFYAELLIRTLIARKSAHVRLGNPPSLNILSFDDASDMLPADQEALKARVDDLRSKWESAMRYSDETGKPVEIFQTFPTSVKFEHKMFGEGITGLTNVPQEIDHYTRSLMQYCMIPLDLLDESSGSAGIGSDKYRILNGILTTTISRHQALLKPVVDRVVINALVALKVNPSMWGRLSWKYLETDLSDEKAVAEIEKLKADTDAVRIANAVEIALNVENGNDAAQAYLNMNDLGYLVDAGT